MMNDQLSMANPMPGLDETQAYEKLQIIAHERTHRKVLEIFSRFPERGRLLEIPAGEGALAWQLAKLGYAVTAGDIDPSFFKGRSISCIYLHLNPRFPSTDEADDIARLLARVEHHLDR